MKGDASTALYRLDFSMFAKGPYQDELMAREGGRIVFVSGFSPKLSHDELNAEVQKALMR